MKKQMVLPCLIATLMFLGIASSILSAGAMVTPPTPLLPSYVVFDQLGVDAPEATILVNGSLLTETFEFEGLFLWNGGAHESGDDVRITDGSTIVDLILWNLDPDEVFTDTLGVFVGTNDQEWGQTGIVIYPVNSGFYMYTISGWGYELEVPEGTWFWNYDEDTWVPDQWQSYYTTIAVSAPVAPPDPTPTPDPTPEPPPTVTHQVFLPAVMVPEPPPACLGVLPVEPFVGWQTPDGFGVCAGEVPNESYVSANHEMFNWFLPLEVAGIWVTPGQPYSDGYVSLSTETHAGLYVVCEDCEGFQMVYALWGEGYYLSWWPYEPQWWDFESQEWSTSQIWGEFTIIALE